MKLPIVSWQAWFCITVCAGLLTFGLFFIWTDQWALPVGDASVRAQQILQPSAKLGDLWTSADLVGPWPKGHELLFEAAVNALPRLGGEYARLHWYQTLSLVACVIGSLLYALIGWQLYGGRAAIAVLAMLAGTGILQDRAASGLTEIHVYFLLALSSYLTLRYVADAAWGRVWCLYLAAVANFLATTMRTEMIVVIFLQWLLLLAPPRRAGLGHTFLFGALSASYFLLRLGYATLIYAGPVNFLNWNRVYHVSTPPWPDISRMLGFLGQALGGSLLIATILLAVLLGWGLWQRRLGSGRWSAAHLYPLACAVVLLAFTVYGLFTGSIEPYSRYLITQLPFAALAVAAVFDERLAPCRARRAAANVAVFAMGSLLAAPVLLGHWKTRDQLDREDRAFLRWVAQTRPAGLAFDNLRGIDGRYIAYLIDSSYTPLTLGHGTGNPLGLALPTEAASPASATWQPEAISRRSTLLRQQHLANPRFTSVVLASDEYYAKEIASRKMGNNKSRKSYFRADLEPLDSTGSVWRFTPRGQAAPLPLMLERAYTDSRILVLKKRPALSGKVDLSQ